MPFVGIGTGRCGSTSLSKILAQCGDVHCTHELKKYRIAWKDQERKPAQQFLNDAHGIFGDVAAYWLPHISWMRERFLVKVIVLKRPRNEFIESVNRKWNGENYYVKEHKFGQSWDKVIRKTPGRTLRESAGKFWDFYYEEVDKLRDIFLLQTSDLNDDRKLKELFDYLGVKKRVYPNRRVWNASS